jgi:hypothetical protein
MPVIIAIIVITIIIIIALILKNLVPVMHSFLLVVHIKLFPLKAGLWGTLRRLYHKTIYNCSRFLINRLFNVTDPDIVCFTLQTQYKTVH